MGNCFKVLSLVLLSIVLSSCTNEAPQNIPKIIGTVTDTDGNLINDVSVYFVYHFSDIPYQRISKLMGVDTVSFTYFTGTETSSGILLEWGTASELNNQGFEVQRKLGSVEYSTIAFVQGYGTSNTPHSYSYTDNYLYSGESYVYRLKQIDFDGSFQYSQEVTIIVSYSGPDTLYQNFPNPFENMTKATYSLSDSAKTRLDFVDYNTLNPLFNYLDLEQEPGRHAVEMHSFNNFPNNIYKLKLNIKRGDSTEMEQMVDLFINRNPISLSQNFEPNCKTVNGKFEADISSLPLHKIINRTSESDWTTIGKIEATDLITFILIKDGYKTLELDYSIDELNQNDFTFKLEKQ